MPIAEFAPPVSAENAVLDAVRQHGFAVASPAWVCQLARAEASALLAVASDWDDMPTDPYLRDGGHYRRRRHASFVVEARGQGREPDRADSCREVPQRAHFQSLEYNALHGGMERWFEPMRASLLARPWWSALLSGLAGLCSELKPAPRWYVEAHQFRIDTSEGIGRPTPEGAHRDGVDFVALFLIARKHIRGGETRVFAADAPHGQRFTLTEPWSVLFLDDARVIHESTPIQPLTDGEGARTSGHRDTLVLSFRKDGFQEAR